MNKILINIDSRQRDNNLYKNSNNYTINIEDILENNIIDNLKIVDIKIPNKYYFFNKIKNNNFFIIKGIFAGPPPGPDVFHLPNNYTIIYIPENTKYEDISNIDELLNNINIELNKSNFNEYDSNNNIKKGIFFSLNEKNKIIINNLSKHYKCELLFDNNFSQQKFSELNSENNELETLAFNKVSNYISSSFGYHIGFRKNNYMIEINNNIIGEFLPNIIDDYIFININNYNNIYINQKTNAFAKLNFKNNNYIIKNYSDYIYNILDSNYIKELNIQLLDYLGNELYFYDNYSLVIEFNIIKKLDNNYINNQNLFYSNTIQNIDFQPELLMQLSTDQNIKNVNFYTQDNSSQINNTNIENNNIKDETILNNNIIVDDNIDEKKKKNKKSFGFDY
jgi:hypothetical protein